MQKILLMILALAATPALADPCEGKLPKKGQHFSGSITYVGDADSFCVGVNRNPNTWIEVRVADFYGVELNAPGGRTAKKRAEQVLMWQPVQCVAQNRSYDRIVARCTIDRRGVGDLLRSAGVPEGGRGYGH